MQSEADKLKIRLLVADTLLRDVFEDWLTLVEQDLNDEVKDVEKLYLRGQRYFEDSGVSLNARRATY